MKSRFIVLTFLFTAILFVPQILATEIAPSGPVRKLQRGFLNVSLSPIEISHELAREKKEDSFIPTWVTGLGRGSFFMAGRALAGVYDMVTAPLPLPSGYGPLVYPEFPWENLEENPKT